LPRQAVRPGVQPLLDHLAARVVGGAGHVGHAAYCLQNRSMIDQPVS
jgi:hypothetical protein